MTARLAAASPENSRMFNKLALPPILMLALLGNSPRSECQTVTVDITPSHIANKFIPQYALGSTVDRVPSNATDVFFRPDQIQKVLSAGTRTCSCRPGIGIPKENGVIHPAKATSSETVRRRER